MITSRNNKIIKDVSKLQKKKYRDTEKKFLIDGYKVLLEAFNSGINIENIFYIEGIDKDLSLFNNLLTEVSDNVLDKISSVKNSEGIVAVAQIPEYDNIDLKNLKKVILLENIQDPGNLGTIIRTADAAGYELIICSQTCADFYSEKTLRASMGSLFHIPVVKVENFKEYIEKLKDRNFSIIGTALNGTELIMNKVRVPEKFGIVFGNEGNGLTQEIIDSCTQLVKIPIFGKAESLNVSIAAGILMYAYIDQ